MNKPFILLRNFGKFSVPDLLTLTRGVVDGTIFSNVEKYPTPPMTKAALSAQMADLQQKYDAARNRDSIAVAEQDLAEKVLLQSLGKVARYAAPIAYNDQAAIEETGFEASSDESHSAEVPDQLVFMPESLPGGAIRINFKTKGKTDSFTVIIAQTALNVVVNGGSDFLQTSGPIYLRTDTHPKMTISNLPHATAFVVYAYASNAAGNGPLSAGMPVVTQ